MDEIKQTFSHCRKIVSLFHSSQPYRTKLKKVLKDMKMPDKQHVNDVVTRWGSKYKMLKRVKELMPATNHILMDDNKNRDLTINWQEAEIIDRIISSLEGFQQLTDMLSGDENVTISSVIPLLRHIFTLCETTDDQSPMEKDIKVAIKNYFETRLSANPVHKNDKKLMMWLRVAEIMDPRYLKISTVDDTPAQLWLCWPSLDEVKESILSKAEEIIKARSDSEAYPMFSSSNSPLKKKQKSSLVGLLMSQNSTRPNEGRAMPPEPTVRERLQRELDFYLRLDADENQCVLDWWKTHKAELPLLSQFARFALSSCASSVPSERLFSVSGYIISKRRNALKPSFVDQLVFLYLNSESV
jgi:hypothetical protein